MIENCAVFFSQTANVGVIVFRHAYKEGYFVREDVATSTSS